MKCPSCGAEIAERSKFCMECGEPVSVQPESEQEFIDIENLSPRRVEETETEAPRYYTKRELRELARKNPDEYYFDPQSYGEAQQYDGNAREYEDITEDVSNNRRSGAAYTAVSIIMALLGALNFFFPFLRCFNCDISAMGYKLSGGMSLYDITMRFLTSENLFTFLTGTNDDYGLSGYLFDKVTAEYNIMRIASVVIVGVYILTLILWFVFVILALARARASAGFGISAAIITIIADVVLLGAISYFNSLITEHTAELAAFSIEPTSLITISITLCVVIFILCIISKIFRKALR